MLLGDESHGIGVTADNYVGVELQDGGGIFGSDGAEQSGLQNLGLGAAIYNHQDLLGLHDGADTHGESGARHFIGRGEEAGVGVDSVLGELNVVGTGNEMIAGLVEADMTVTADTQQLHIDAAQGIDESVVAGTLSGGIGVLAVGHVGVGQIDVDLGEEILVHEVAVTLVVLAVEAVVLVQIYGAYLLEADLALSVLLSQLGVHSQRGRTGSQADYGGGLCQNLCSHKGSGTVAHGIVIFFHINADHGDISFTMLIFGYVYYSIDAGRK